MIASKEETKDSASAQNGGEVEARVAESKDVHISLDDDEGMKVVAAYTGDTDWTEEEEKTLVRKIDLRLLTLLTASYGLQFYDKTMLGQAVSLRGIFVYHLGLPN